MNSQKILISGASGLIGSALTNLLNQKGHSVSKLVRREAKNKNEVQWNPKSGVKNLNDLENFDAVIHLAGENIGGKRWTEEQKKKIRESRVQGTSVLKDEILKLKNPPKAFISASAIGIYGDRGNEILDEESAVGTGFLPELCQEWENSSKPLTQKGIRTVYVRTGVVLAPNGGALAKMLFPFKMGVGGIIGNGKQFMSWVELEDLTEIFSFAIENENVSGAINAVSPNSVTNHEFTKTLGKVLKRPTIFPLPSFVAKIVLGEMAQDLLLASSKVTPKKLLSLGYKFGNANLESAFRKVLN
ncbi:MAG: TIGR01777 family protein [Calditrichaeota bacterium]|nr:MAG: TIGR01777 family protein [Calditrichota bacterium]